MKIDKPVSADKSLYAYQEIKDFIVKGRLTPDTPLSEAYFVERLNISRTPIRAALQRLQHEGFLRIVPKQGIVVRELGLDEAIQLMELHFVIEHYLILNSVSALNEQDYKQLSAMIEKQKVAAAHRQYDDYLVMDQQFHIFCYHHHRNQYMVNILNNFRERFYPWRYQSLLVPGRIEKSIQEHEQLVKFISEKKFEEAYELMRNHMQHLRMALENRLANTARTVS